MKPLYSATRAEASPHPALQPSTALAETYEMHTQTHTNRTHKQNTRIELKKSNLPAAERWMDRVSLLQ